MNTLPDISGYRYENANLNPSHNYLLPEVVKLLSELELGTEKRLFELGCGNGAIASHLASLGYRVTGIDASEEGIANANAQFRRSICTRVQLMMSWQPSMEPILHYSAWRWWSIYMPRANMLVRHLTFWRQAGPRSSRRHITATGKISPLP